MKIRVIFNGNCPDKFQTRNRTHPNIVDLELFAMNDEEMLTRLYSEGFTGIESIMIFTENGKHFHSTRVVKVPYPSVRKFVQPYSNQFR